MVLSEYWMMFYTGVVLYVLSCFGGPFALLGVRLPALTGGAQKKLEKFSKMLMLLGLSLYIIGSGALAIPMLLNLFIGSSNF